MAAALVGILAFLAYANSVSSGFVWDDHQQVVMNANLRPNSPYRDLLAPNDWAFARSGVRPPSNYYRPLQMLTYRLTADIFDFDVGAFHAVNLAFHVIAALLAFSLFSIWTGSTASAFAAAALFAVHPIHSEAVDWIAALPDVACTAFFLLAFLLFALARRRQAVEQSGKQPAFGHVPLLACSLIAFAAALLWKETAIILPLAIAAYVFCLSQDAALLARVRQAIKISLPYWCILGLYFLLRFRVLGFLVIRQRGWILSPFEFSLTALQLVARYCWKLLFPIGLDAYYVFDPVRTLRDPRAIAAILFLILAAVALSRGYRRAPLAAFGAAWVFIALIPVLNVYAVGRNVFCERYLYLPSVGFCLFIVLVVARAGRLLPERFRWPIAAVGLAAVLFLFGTATFTRNAVWKDDLTLFTRTLEASPNASFVEGMVAALQPNTAAGQAAAESHYSRAISLAASETPPDRSEIAIAGEGLASIYASRGNFDAALSTLGQVRAADPKDPQVDGEEGLILIQAGRWQQAEAALRKAVAISPNDANVLNALGLLVWHHYNQPDKAASYFTKALDAHSEADDFSASLHSNLGAVYGEQGRFADAISQFQIALQITPGDPEYLTNLATAFRAVGRLDDARKTLQAALAAAPNYDPARQALQQMEHN